MRKKVLATLDGSATSRQILPVIRRLFAPDEITLTFLRIALPLAEPPSMSFLSQTNPLPDIHLAHWDTQLAEQEWNAYCRALAEELEREAELFRQDGYTVQTAIETGTPVAAIATYIANHEITLLAMATHGRRGLSKMILGSVAEELLRLVSIPVLLIRPTGEEENYNGEPS